MAVMMENVRSITVLNSVSSEGFENRLSLWEQRYEKQYGVDTKVLRAMLLSLLDHYGKEGKSRDYYTHRWEHAFFDSVSPDFFVISDIYIPTLTQLRSGKSSSFLPALECQSDKYWAKGNYLPPQDPTPKIMIEISEGRIQGIREKKNGTLLTVVEKGGQKYISGPNFNSPVGKDFVPTAIEWTPEGLFVLHPLALPTSTYQEVVFLGHPFSNELPTPDKEGAIFLVGGVEYRLKYYPTLEFSIDGSIWECAQGEAGLIPLKPRHGMKASKDMSALERLPSLHHLPDRVYRKTEEVTSGSVESVGITESDVTIIDSGYRSSAQGWVIAHDSFTVCLDGVYTVAHKGGWKVSPFPYYVECKIGAKLILFSPFKQKKKTSSPDVVYVFKDGLKSWDWVGGTIEPGESPSAALHREFAEETGQVLLDSPTCIGISDSFEEGVLYRSIVYLAPFKAYKGHWKPYEDWDNIGVAPWTNRIYEYAANETDSYTKCSVVWRNANSVRHLQFSVSDTDIPPAVKKYIGQPYTKKKPRYPCILRPIDIAHLRAGGIVEPAGDEEAFLLSDVRWPVRSDPRLKGIAYDPHSYKILCARRSYYDRHSKKP